MKILFLIISLLFISVKGNAQKENAVKYVWHNDNTNLKAAVEIYDNDSQKRKGIIYFITGVDSIFNSKQDSLFNYFFKFSTSQYVVVKISFYDVIDSGKYALFSKEIIDFIMPDVESKYHFSHSSQFILTGINDYALLALYAATHNSKKINKTALFFNELSSQKLLLDNKIYTTNKKEGKLFLYVNNTKGSNFTIDYLAENLVKTKSLVIYKYEDINGAASQNIFLEAYNWLMADGNNYIIHTDD